MIHVSLKIHYDTKYGEALFLFGNVEELGKWQETKAKKMFWNEGNYWTVSFKMEVPTKIEYLYFVSGETGTQIRQEACEPRVLDLSEAKEFIIEDFWEKSFPQNIIKHGLKELNKTDSSIEIEGFQFEKIDVQDPSPQQDAKEALSESEQKKEESKKLPLKEEILFETRGKLFRYDSENRQWKTKGVGVAKLLKEADSGKIRFLMRRDKILKLCANHYLSSCTSLNPSSFKENTYIWTAPDSSGEDDPQKFVSQVFALHIFDEIDARTFKEKFQEYQRVEGSGKTEPEFVDSSDTLPLEDEDDKPPVFSLTGEVEFSCKKEEIFEKESEVDQEQFEDFDENQEEQDSVENFLNTFSGSDTQPMNKREEEKMEEGEEMEIEEPSNEEFQNQEVLKDEKILSLEDEEELFGIRAKLFRFDPTSNGWKDSGIGMVKFLKHKATGHIRLTMRDDSSLRTCANYHILSGSSLNEYPGDSRAWVWETSGSSQESPKKEIFAIRLSDTESAQLFKSKFEQFKKDSSSVQDKSQEITQEKIEQEAPVRGQTKKLEIYDDKDVVDYQEEIVREVNTYLSKQKESKKENNSQDTFQKQEEEEENDGKQLKSKDKKSSENNTTTNSFLKQPQVALAIVVLALGLFVSYFFVKS